MLIFEIIKKIVLVILILFNTIVFYTTYNVINNSKCDCVSAWKCKLLSVLAIAILIFAIINLFIPTIISILVKIPLLGGLIIALIISMLGIQIYLVNSMMNEIKDCSTCSISNINNSSLDVINGFSITIYAISIIIIGLTITLL